MKKLTKRRALFLCYLLWTWLSKHPDKGKTYWPRWNYNGGDIRSVCNDCFACQISIACDKCMMLSVWGKNNFCTTYESPYRQWELGINKSENAKIIAHGALKLYNREMTKG